MSLQATIESKLVAALVPFHMEVVNESYKHNVPKGAESHFNVLIVSSAFEGKSLLERHRLVNTTLKDELKQGIHALSIQPKTPAQFGANPSLAPTPSCMGGKAAEEKAAGAAAAEVKE